MEMNDDVKKWLNRCCACSTGDRRPKERDEDEEMENISIQNRKKKNENKKRARRRMEQAATGIARTHSGQCLWPLDCGRGSSALRLPGSYAGFHRVSAKRFYE